MSAVRREIHILKYFSSFVSVSQGKVINITEPRLSYCPLAAHLYKSFKNIPETDKKAIKNAIKTVIESKIRDYGLFTDNRKFNFDSVSIPYGASEMISFALKKKEIDAAVVVCEGAGTVIADTAKIVQGIGARMNSLLLTSPIKGIIKRLKTSGCRIVFENALIDQIKGVWEAIKAGYKRIAVTINGNQAEDLIRLRSLEKENTVTIVSLVVCTTGVSEEKVTVMRDYADLVWSCASFDVRNIVGPAAKIQLSAQIPVFILTEKGVRFFSAYCRDPEQIIRRDLKKQYFISGAKGKERIAMGDFNAFISETKLPVGARSVPRFALNLQ